MLESRAQEVSSNFEILSFILFVISTIVYLLSYIQSVIFTDNPLKFSRSSKVVFHSSKLPWSELQKKMLLLNHISFNVVTIALLSPYYFFASELQFVAEGLFCTTLNKLLRFFYKHVSVEMGGRFIGFFHNFSFNSFCKKIIGI